MCCVYYFWHAMQPNTDRKRERERKRQTDRQTGAVYLLSSPVLSTFQPCYLSSELSKLTFT
jgi:hypothetical protein